MLPRTIGYVRGCLPIFQVALVILSLFPARSASGVRGLRASLPPDTFRDVREIGADDTLIIGPETDAGSPSRQSSSLPRRQLQQNANTDGGGQYTLTVQVRLEAARLPGSKLRLVLRLERQPSPGDAIAESPDAAQSPESDVGWITWGTAPERTVPLNSEGVPEVSEHLSEIELRFRTGEPPQFSNGRAALSLVFNEEFKVIPATLIAFPG